MTPSLGILPKSLSRASLIAAFSAITLAFPATALPLRVARPGLAPAGDWYVDASNPNCPGSGAPGDPFCAIQDGIEAASDGDTVHVAPGTYVETIDFLGKAITVASTGGAAVTVIDGNQAGPVVTFQSGETASSVLDGFTVTHGVGGVACNSSSPTITRSTITGNFNIVEGGGISCHESSPTITHSLISGNEAAFGGGGISCNFGAPTITDSIVEGNTAVAGEILGVKYPGVGGGIFAWATSLTIHRTAIRGNGAVTGGGLYCVFSWLTVANAAVHGNTAWGDFDTGLPGEGGGIFSWFPNVANISHTTVSGNHADLGGGLYSNDFPAAGPTITHSIFWANGSNEASGPVTVTHTNIAGGWGGTGNIDADPLFVDAASGDFRLRPGSPCIDAGDMAAAPTGTDLGGNPRFLDGDLDRTKGTDMGAYEFSHVHLQVTGAAVPGGTLTLTTSGTPGMYALLIIGLRPGDVSLGRYGALLIDQPLIFRPLGMIPKVSTVAIPANLPPLTVYMQELAVSFNKRAGTTGNLVELRVQ